MAHKRFNMFDERTQPIIVPNWMWQMAKEGAIKTGTGTHSAFIRSLMVDHAKRNNYWQWWDDKVKKQQQKGE